jgi:anti-sigma B factor antagonist
MISKAPNLDVVETGDVSVVHLGDQRRLDEFSTQQLGTELFRLVEEEGRRKLVLDFEAVEFLSSAALGKLIALSKKTHTRGGALKLCNLDNRLLEIFAITRLDRLFDIRLDEADAVAAF